MAEDRKAQLVEALTPSEDQFKIIERVKAATITSMLELTLQDGATVGQRAGAFDTLCYDLLRSAIAAGLQGAEIFNGTAKRFNATHGDNPVPVITNDQLFEKIMKTVKDEMASAVAFVERWSGGSSVEDNPSVMVPGPSTMQ